MARETWLPRGGGARSRRLGSLAAVALSIAASAPSVSSADPPRSERGERAVRQGASGRAASIPLTVAVGATSGEGGAREILDAELADAIVHQPALRLGAGNAHDAALVVSARVRSLTVQTVGPDAIAQCELGVVVADGSGAVRAMLDARRVVRGAGGTSELELRRMAVRGAVAGAIRNLVTQLAR